MRSDVLFLFSFLFLFFFGGGGGGAVTKGRVNAGYIESPSCCRNFLDSPSCLLMLLLTSLIYASASSCRIRKLN